MFFCYLFENKRKFEKTNPWFLKRKKKKEKRKKKKEKRKKKKEKRKKKKEKNITKILHFGSWLNPLYDEKRVQNHFSFVIIKY